MRPNRGLPGGGLKSGRLYADRDVGDRDRDRAVERSTALESFDQCSGRSTVGAVNGELQCHRIEQRHVGACLTRTIQDGVKGHADRPDLHVRLAGDDLDQLDPARRYTGEEDLGRRKLFARTAVLHGPVDDEVVCAGIAQYAAKDVGGAGGEVVFPQR